MSNSSQAENNNTENDTAQQQAVQERVVLETMDDYVFSFRWLLIGLLFVAVVGGSLALVYAYRTQGMAAHITDVAKDLIAESDKDKESLKTAKTDEEKIDLAVHSRKVRQNAANLLNNYLQTEKTPSSSVQELLYEVMDSLYKDSVYDRGERAKQLIDLCVRLIQNVPEAETIKYRTRLVELEWDRRNFNGIIERGKDLLRTNQNINGTTDNYDALRYITLAVFERLPVTAYDPAALQLSAASFPREMDDLLKKLYVMKPGDVDVASKYAEFVIDVRRDAFARCATDQLLRQMTQEDRQALAIKIINDTVSRNKDNARAYLARYYFMKRFVPAENLQDRANDDLEAVLKIEPGNAEALILSALDSLQQMQVALRDGKPDKAEEWKKKAEELFRRTVRDNPAYVQGYQYLGDFLIGERKLDEAVQVWEKGVNSAARWLSEELLGRIIMVLLSQKKIEEAKVQTENLTKAIAEMRLRRPQAVEQTTNMRTLLIARLYVTESQVIQSKLEEIKESANSESSRRVYARIQQLRGDAMQLLDGLLRGFGISKTDYVIEGASVYNRLLPDSLLLAGNLKMDMGIWDSAAKYFEAAIPFGAVRRVARQAAAAALQQGNQIAEATQMLGLASRENPDDLAVRFEYANSLFRSQLALTNADPKALDTVKTELDELEKHRAELAKPWIIDIRLVHLELAKASLSNSADAILAAQNEAVKNFRTLEDKTFSPDKDGNVKKYIDAPDFVFELVGIYSSLSAIADFDRLLPKLREFPDGEASYYMARINDSLRRDDRDGTVALIEQATSSDRLTDPQKERFVNILQNLKGTNNNKATLERVYSQLKTTFDQNPESLKPQAFFLLANMCMDREDIESAKLVRDRLQKIEGASGTMWRYITVRLMLTEKVPDFLKIRQIYEEIVKERDQWNMAYVLGATIEEKFLEANPDDEEAKSRLLNALQLAIQNGSQQPEIWGKLADLYNKAGRTEDGRNLLRNAALRGIMLDSQTGQFPQPYSRMYSQIQEAIANTDAPNADMIARQCIALASKRHEKPDLIFALNLAIGKAFFDAQLFDSAKRHLTIAAERGGAYVYPLAVCVAKSGDVDGGFTILLDEMNETPSATPTLLPSVIVLLSQVKPSEKIYERIDKLMNRVERGDRLTLSGKLEASPDQDNEIPLGTKRIRSIVIRFTDKTEIDPASIRFLPPEAPKPENP